MGAPFEPHAQPPRGARFRALALCACVVLASGGARAQAGRDTPPPVPEIYAAEASDLKPNWSAAKATLGRRLFQDRQLSRDRSLSCQDCHVPRLAFTDGRRVAIGVHGRVGARNTPTLVNRTLGRYQFWDGRAATLEEQACGPMTNPNEMGMSLAGVVERLQADRSYAADFQRAFGGGPTLERLELAIAAYGRTIYSVDAPFDRFAAGDSAALSPAAQRGLKLFGGKARCGECHSVPNFSDEAFHNLGLPGDAGRGAVTHLATDAAAFKTPTLREVALTAPYMHDGSKATLMDVIEYYDQGGQPHANLDAKVTKLGLTLEEKRDLVAFMESLSGHIVEGPVSAQKETR